MMLRRLHDVLCRGAWVAIVCIVVVYAVACPDGFAASNLQEQCLANEGPAAQEACRSYVQKDRSRAAIIRLGRKLEQQSLFKNAVVVYAQGLVYHPNHKKLIRLHQSAESYRKEDEGPRNTELGTGTRAARLAEIKCMRLQGKGALEACQQAIALDPDNATFYKRFGDVLTVLDRGAEASKAYQKARELGLASAGLPESPQPTASPGESQPLLGQLRMLNRLRKEASISIEEHKKRKTMLLDAAFH